MEDQTPTSTATNVSSKSISSGVDDETRDRIKNLAYVGKVLMQMQTTSDSSFQTDFFIAREALNKFKVGIDRLNLDPESQKGMNDLIAYLEKKIEKRLKYSRDAGNSPMV